MKNITTTTLFLLTAFISPQTLAETSISEKYREPDLQLSTYKIDDNYYGSLSGTINVNENISIDATIETNGYLEIGSAYGEVLFDAIYVEGYANYGRTDTTDIYTLGIFAGLPVTDSFMLFANTSYDWRRTQDNLAGVGNLGLFDEDEWKNTVGFNYSLHKWLSFSSSYNIDYLTDAPNPVDNKVATSWDVMLTANSPWFSPYVKYSQGDYRVTPDQDRKSQNNVELGIKFNF
ncbi:MAG: hypothetical protein GY951_08910 [Psychromonas sp.]|nr:hypothetical protein [Psychromonas sp.]